MPGFSKLGFCVLQTFHRQPGPRRTDRRSSHAARRQYPACVASWVQVPFQLRKMGRCTSGGRAAPTVARGPGDLCLATTGTECRRGAEIEPWVQCSLPLWKTKRTGSNEPALFVFQCGRWDLNPHDEAITRSLVLLVCQFRHFRIQLSHRLFISDSFYIISKSEK